jgi:muramidase (phage lysozyme)
MQSATQQFAQFESKAKSHIKNVETAWSKLGQSNFSQGFLSGFGIQRGQGLDALAGGAAANLLSAGIQKGIDKMETLSARGMEYYDTVQMTKMAFGTLLNDMEKGKLFTKDILQFSRVTPYDDAPTLKYAQSLLAVGIQAQDVTKYLTGMGNAMAAAGDFSLAAQEGTIKAFRDILSKPALMSQDVKLQLSNWIPSTQADWAAALGLSKEQFLAKMEAGEIKSGPAAELLIDYWNKKKAGMMQFAGEHTFEGLESSKRSAEALAMANMFAGGDVVNPSATGAGATRLQILAEEIKRRDEFSKPGELQNALGDIATAYLKARDKDDEILFSLTRSSAANGAGSILTNTATKVSNDMSAPPGYFLGESITEYAQKKTGIKPLNEYVPQLNALNPSWEDLGNAPSNLIGWAKSLFSGATASAIDSVEQGKGPMKEAGATLGDATIQGMKSTKGLDSQSPSKRAIAEGINVRQGLANGLLDPTVDIKGAGISLADELFSGLHEGLARRGGGFIGGMSERQYLEQVSQDPKVKAFFEAIKKAEGGAPDVMAGGRHVNSGPLHPGEVVPMSQWFRTSQGPSSAAGDWQITRTNWRNIAPQLGLDNFSDEHQQLLAALKLFKDRGGLPALLSGNIEAARNIAALDWTSTPGSSIGGGKQLSEKRWMGYFNDALGNGGSVVATAQPITPSNPMPVTIIDAGNGVDFRSGPSFYDQKDQGLQQHLNAARGMYAARKQYRPATKAGPQTLNDPVPVMVEVIGAAQTLGQSTFPGLNEKALMLKKPLELLGESATAAAAGLGSVSAKALLTGPTKTEGGMTDAEIAAKRAESLGSGKRKAHRNKQFDPMFTWEGAAGDFGGGLQSLLAGLGWEKPTSLAKQFGTGLLKDIQGRLAHDFSAMITGSLFGFPKGGTGDDANKLVGGWFSKLFGSLFGGARASGGPMLPGRFYLAGEHGQELIAGPGHVYNARETRQMMSGGGTDTHVYLALGDRAIDEMNNSWYSSRRAMRHMLKVQARYGKLMRV